MVEQYVTPSSVEEALESLANGVPEAKVLAGGTDLVVDARVGKRPLPKVLIGLALLTGLRGITEVNGGLRVGALVTYAELLTASTVLSDYTALADACALVGSPATRHVGTLGGNIANGSPAMETGSPLLVCGAGVEVSSVRGRRVIDLERFLEAPGRVALQQDEIIVSVILPAARQFGTAYARLGYRRAMEIAVVGAAAAIALDADGCCSEARVALTAVAPTCVLVPDAEAVLLGEAPTDEVIAAAADRAARVASPIDDIRATAAYRRAMVPMIVRRVLELAATRAKRATVGNGRRVQSTR